MVGDSKRRHFVSVQVSTRIDEATKQQFDKVCEAIGTSPSTILSMFIRGVVDNNSIPSNVAIPSADFQESTEPVNRAFQIGCMKGEIWMSDDFDAPMEEFEEYM